MLNSPLFTQLDWLTDTAFHAGLLGINYALFGKEKLLRNYLLSLLGLSLVLSYWLKHEPKENV